VWDIGDALRSGESDSSEPPTLDLGNNLTNLQSLPRYI
jgi:hypothetical protein